MTANITMRRPAYPIDGPSRACALCGLPIEGPHLADDDTGLGFHPACMAERAPRDAVVALLGALALVLIPAVLVWAS